MSDKKLPNKKNKFLYAKKNVFFMLKKLFSLCLKNNRIKDATDAPIITVSRLQVSEII